MVVLRWHSDLDHLPLVVLRLDPKDSDALQAKLSLLMEDGQYPAALQLLDTIESPSEEDAFKRAYALYRSHREADAAELLSGMKEKSPDDRKILHLEAQTVRYSKCLLSASSLICVKLDL